MNKFNANATANAPKGRNQRPRAQQQRKAADYKNNGPRRGYKVSEQSPWTHGKRDNPDTGDEKSMHFGSTGRPAVQQVKDAPFNIYQPPVSQALQVRLWPLHIVCGISLNRTQFCFGGTGSV